MRGVSSSASAQRRFAAAALEALTDAQLLLGIIMLYANHANHP